MVRQDVLANNLANANAPGFKKDISVAEAFPEKLLSRIGETITQDRERKPLPPMNIGTLGTGAAVAVIATDYSSGSLRATENHLDLALRSDGFFTVETPQGLRYTRDGSFHLTPEGRLVTSNGYPVMGRNGYIEPEGSFVVDEVGNVLVGAEIIETFNIVSIEDRRQLQKVGDNLFQMVGQEPENMENPQVLQGYLESSNVNPVREMVDLITVVRAYELSQKVIQAQDETLDRIVNQVGRL